MDVRAEVVNVGAAAFEQASADINLASDVLLAPFSMRLGDGGLDGEIGLAATPEQTLALKLDYTLQGLSLEQFGLLPTEELRGGKLSSKLSINSQGRSPAELAAALSGSGHFMMRDAMLQNDLIEIAGSDLILEMLSKLNPFQKKDPTTQLQCGLVRFNAQEGQVSLKNGLAVETRKMVIAGKGKIDLANETLDLTFTPSARQGVGINVGSLVKFVKLGGTLLNPSPALDAAGALQSGLAIGAALSTGGVSVLAEGLAKRVVNSGSACDRLGKPESTSTAAEEQQQTPVEQQEEQPEEQPEEQQEQPDDTPTG